MREVYVKKHNILCELQITDEYWISNYIILLIAIILIITNSKYQNIKTTTNTHAAWSTC